MARDELSKIKADVRSLKRGREARKRKSLTLGLDPELASRVGGELKKAFQTSAPEVDRAIDDLAERWMPKVSPEISSEIALVLKLAQKTSPVDKHHFVHVANRLLDTFQLRMLSGGELYRLRVLRVDGVDHIQLLGERKKGKGFKRTKFKLSGVSETYGRPGNARMLTK